MRTRRGTRSGKTGKTRGWKFSSQASVRIVVALFAYLPMSIGALVAWWVGWGVDGWLLSTMIGGILGAVLLLVVFLLYVSSQERKSRCARR